MEPGAYQSRAPGPGSSPETPAPNFGSTALNSSRISLPVPLHHSMQELKAFIGCSRFDDPRSGLGRAYAKTRRSRNGEQWAARCKPHSQLLLRTLPKRKVVQPLRSGCSCSFLLIPHIALLTHRSSRVLTGSSQPSDCESGTMVDVSPRDAATHVSPFSTIPHEGIASDHAPKPSLDKLPTELLE